METLALHLAKLKLAISPNVGNSGAKFLVVGDCVRASPFTFKMKTNSVTMWSSYLSPFPPVFVNPCQGLELEFIFQGIEVSKRVCLVYSVCHGLPVMSCVTHKVVIWSRGTQFLFVMGVACEISLTPTVELTIVSISTTCPMRTR